MSLISIALSLASRPRWFAQAARVTIATHIDIGTPIMYRALMEIHRITIQVAKRSDLDIPSDIDEAISLVRTLLEQGSLLEVISVEPEGKKNKSLQWG
jgi:hypothetical protein